MASEDDYFSRLECKKLILSHMEKGEWKSVLEYYDSKQTYREPNLVWIKPSLDMLQFIESCLIGYLGLKKVNNVISSLICNVNSAAINQIHRKNRKIWLVCARIFKDMIVRNRTFYILNVHFSTLIGVRRFSPLILCVL